MRTGRVPRTADRAYDRPLRNIRAPFSTYGMQVSVQRLIASIVAYNDVIAENAVEPCFHHLPI